MWGRCNIVTEGIRVGVKAGGVPKPKVVVSREELPGAREGDVGFG